jgi:hypothetical protein
MWEKLGLREKERRLGSLFGGVLVCCFIFGILADRAPGAAIIVALIVVAIVILSATRYAVVRLRVHRKKGGLTTGRLSSDERAKAQIKLRRVSISGTCKSHPYR